MKSSIYQGAFVSGKRDEEADFEERGALCLASVSESRTGRGAPSQALRRLAWRGGCGDCVSLGACLTRDGDPTPGPLGPGPCVFSPDFVPPSFLHGLWAAHTFLIPMP